MTTKTDKTTKAKKPAEEKCQEEEAKNFRKKAEEYKKMLKSPIESKFEEEMEKGKDFAKSLFEAMTRPEVQQHFMAMAKEFMLGMTEFMKALPIPEDMKAMAKQEFGGDCANCKGPGTKKKPTTPKKKPAIEKIEVK